MPDVLAELTVGLGLLRWNQPRYLWLSPAGYAAWRYAPCAAVLVVDEPELCIATHEARLPGRLRRPGRSVER